MSRTDPVLTVYTFDRNKTRYSFSPFTVKLLFRLRYGSVVYEHLEGSRKQAPKSKVPYVRFRDSGKLMGDSSLITGTLIEQGLLGDLNSVLLAELKAQDHCLRAFIEETLYYLLIYERWRENYASMRDDGPFSYVPGFIRGAVGFFVYTYCRLMLYFQGTGRYSVQEARQLKKAAVETLGNYSVAAHQKRLEKQPSSDDYEPFWILGGDKPTEADFTVFGFLATVAGNPKQNPELAEMIHDQKTLRDYMGRIHKKFFSELTLDC